MSDLDLLTLGELPLDGALAAGLRAAAASATDILADEARRDQALDRTLAALDSDDATLTDVRAVLCALGRSHATVDPVRVMGVCMRLAGTLGRFSADIDAWLERGRVTAVRRPRRRRGAA